MADSVRNLRRMTVSPFDEINSLPIGIPSFIFLVEKNDSNRQDYCCSGGGIMMLKDQTFLERKTSSIPV